MSDSGKSPDIFEGYTDQDRPLGSYVALIGFFNALFALFLLVTRRSGRELPGRVALADLVLCGVATHKLSWLLANDVVTSPLRAPFTRFQELESPTNVEEEPRGRGFRRAMGELVTCTFCMGQWIAAFFTYGLVLAPTVTRVIGSVFAMLTLSDFMHQIYKALVNRA